MLLRRRVLWARCRRRAWFPAPALRRWLAAPLVLQGFGRRRCRLRADRAAPQRTEMSRPCRLLHPSFARMGSPREHLPFHAWAQRPPMGWNSWDCFATTVTEEQVKANADYMAAHLARYGWHYVVVDIQWYEPGATGFQYRED